MNGLIRPEIAEANQVSLNVSAPGTGLDAEKQAVEHVESAGDETVVDMTPAEEARGKKVVRRLDAIIIPITALLYVATSLNRSNIGNAKLQGLTSILGKTKTEQSNHYSIAVSAFYISYIVFNLPGNIIVTHVSPEIVVGAGAFIWGLASTAQAGAHNFAGIVVCRLFIGLGEACFGVAISVYYSIWYKRDEVATRLSFYIGMGSLAGAFSGLIAYGVSFIHSSTPNFRILFLIEGIPTIILAIITYFCLPSTPETWRYLSDSDRSILHRRLVDTGFNRRHKFDKSAIKRVLTCHTTYLNAFLYMSHNLSLGSLSGFFPTIIATFGYSNAKAQLYTVPPYAVSFVGTLAVAWISDRYKTRGIPCAILLIISAIGLAILVAVPHNNAVRYFATFPTLLGAFGNGPLMLGWAANTAGSHSAAAIRLGTMAALGQCFSVLASYCFPASEGPQYYRGFGLNLAFAVAAAFVALYMTWYYRRENARRDRIEGVNGHQLASEGAAPGMGKVSELEAHGERQPKQLHDLTPGFRYYV